MSRACWMDCTLTFTARARASVRGIEARGRESFLIQDGNQTLVSRQLLCGRGPASGDCDNSDLVILGRLTLKTLNMAGFRTTA